MYGRNEQNDDYTEGKNIWTQHKGRGIEAKYT